MTYHPDRIEADLLRLCEGFGLRTPLIREVGLPRTVRWGDQLFRLYVVGTEREYVLPGINIWRQLPTLFPDGSSGPSSHS